MGTVANGWVSFGYFRRLFEFFHPARAGVIGFAIDVDRYSRTKHLQRILIDGSIYLYPVFPFVCKFGIEQTMIQLFVIGQQQKPLTVEIQAANGIHVIGHGKKIFQDWFSVRRSKLRQDIERLIYDEITRHDVPDYLKQKSRQKVQSGTQFR